MTLKNLLFEKLLIERLKSGDPDSFSDIFSVYYKDLVFYSYSIIRDLSSAEDVVQDTFIKLWEDREKLIITVSLKSYLLKSIQNRCIDWHRHKKILDNHSTFVLNNSSLYEYNTDNYLLRSEMEEMIERTLVKLPEKVRESYELNRIEGLKYHEIANKLNVSVRTVEVRISKALELLRKGLIDFL